MLKYLQKCIFGFDFYLFLIIKVSCLQELNFKHLTCAFIYKMTYSKDMEFTDHEHLMVSTHVIKLYILTQPDLTTLTLTSKNRGIFILYKN